MLIKNNCKFRIASTREKIYTLGNNTFLVYSIGTIATNQVCPKSNTLSPVTIKSGHSITVQAGCNIPTMDHVISADDSEETQILNSWLDWTMSLPELFNHKDAVIWKKCCAQTPSTAPTPAIVAQVPAPPPPQINIQNVPQPQMPFPQQNPPAYTHQNPTFNVSKPTAPVLIYT